MGVDEEGVLSSMTLLNKIGQNYSRLYYTRIKYSSNFLLRDGSQQFLELYRIALLITDPPHASSSARQNKPICNPPLHIAVIC